MWRKLLTLKMIKFILNRVPRGVLQRLAGWMMPVAGLLYAGRKVQCPLCGARYRRFMPYGYVSVRKNALCPRCLSLERHRLLWLWLESEARLEGRFLHIAPEACLSRRFEKIFPPGDYITADLESPLAGVRLDVQDIPFPDDTFDIVFCNHVLEHVADDRRAMSEMFRVMKPGGWGVMLSPVDEDRATTFEDDTVVDPAERTRLFGQYDHRRVYGRDYADRLRGAGWEVDEIDYCETLPPALRELHALRPEKLYTVRRRR
jgi:SAM-dependent methyltransferase